MARGAVLPEELGPARRVGGDIDLGALTCNDLLPILAGSAEEREGPVARALVRQAGQLLAVDRPDLAGREAIVFQRREELPDPGLSGQECLQHGVAKGGRGPLPGVDERA